jgi:hypothetical protein
MADLKNLGDEIRTLLRQLNGRQKATLFAFGAVILVPLLWLSVRSTDESWLAVRDGAELEPADISQAEQALRESGISDFRVDGQRVFVPAGKLPLADAALAAAGLTDTKDQNDAEPATSVFEAFQPAGTVERKSQERLHRNIERALTTISGIQTATVISSRSKPARWGQKAEVDAAVYVSPASGNRLTPELRASICASVARMIPDLVPERIVVTDQSTGRSWTSDADGATVIDAQELAEQYEARIEAALTWIPDAEVSVHVPAGFASAIEASRPPNDPGEARSLPNQPGAVSAVRSRLQTVHVEVLVPDKTDSETARVVAAAELALPPGVLAEVLISQKPAMPTSGELFAEEATAGTPLLPALAMAVLLVSTVFAWRLRTPAPDIAAASPEEAAAELPHELDEDEHEKFIVPEPNHSVAVLEKELPPQIERPQPRFTFLQQTGPRELYRLLAGEHPQTLALVLRHLPTTLATDVVSLLPSGIQSEVIRRIAEADLTGADVVLELEETLRIRAASAPVATPTDVSSAASITPMLQKRLLTPMERFEEIVKLTPPNLKRVVEGVEESLWADALHEASEALRFRVIASLPPQQARSVRARLSQPTPPRTEIETTRNRIVETVNALRLPDDAPPLRHEFVA